VPFEGARLVATVLVDELDATRWLDRTPQSKQ
jgi:hypothetical protein